jgi:hypothetical protein
MKNVFRLSVALFLLITLHLNSMQTVQACGPSYLTPVFDYTYAPERPWTDFASGKLGIIKPEYRRSVLFAAYRYLNGSGFSAPEQQALVETWEAQFNRVEPKENSMSEAVDLWIKARKSVLGDSEKTPEIYTERKYGDSYDFFPNCSKNAFEVAAKTLADRALNYNSDSKEVKEWLAGQDQVFNDCAGTKADLKELGTDAPEWLRKDRDYQFAASAFYSTNYEDARKRFESIAADGDSPWHEVADYLVARTLVRRASLGEDADVKSNNTEAEEYLNQLIGRATTYNNDARRLLNLVKFRIHPEERERELAQKLPFQNDAAELRQDLIDYTWLLDQLESEALKKEEARKEALKPPATPDFNMTFNKAPVNTAPTTASNSASANVDMSRAMEAANKALEAARAAMNDTNTAMNSTNAMTNAPAQPTYQPEGGYKGGYYGSEESSLSLLPSYLGDDELTEWIFTFQIQNDEAYLHALDRWKQSGSQMWLMTAISKAKPELRGFRELMDAAKEVSPSSPAYYTIAYHQAKILIGQNNKPEARKILARVLDESGDMPISTRNLFMQQRMKVAETLSEFLAASTRRPFGFSYDDDTARTIDEIIAEQKSWYNAEYEEKSQAEYDLGIENEFAAKRLWQDRQFFDDEVAGIINSNFPTSMMIEILGKPELPDYLKRRLVLTIWTRAYLLKDEKTALGMAPQVVAVKPEIAPFMAAYTGARTPAERETAGLYLLLKNGDLSPYLQTGFEPETAPQVDMWQDERWWCEQYDYTYDNNGNEIPAATFNPPFLTRPQSDQARTQKASLKKIEDGVSYLSGRVLKWAQTGVPDKRLPEALYLIFQGNQWIKYSCGNASEETREKAGDILKTRYPRSKWTAQMFADIRESESDQ